MELGFVHLLNRINCQDLTIILKKHVTKQDGMEYNTIPLEMQYDMLKSYIATDKMQHLSLCLKHKFNPNRYHKKISLLHYAIKQDKPQAIPILSNYNPDLIPLYREKTPLEYAYYLEFTDCINAMAYAIQQKYDELVIHRKHCGLTKHILKPKYSCAACIADLHAELQYHNIWQAYTG